MQSHVLSGVWKNYVYYNKFHTVVCYHHILCIYSLQTCLAQRAEADSVELMQVPTEGKT